MWLKISQRNILSCERKPRLGPEINIKKNAGLRYECIPLMNFCTLADTTEFYISTVLIKKM